VAEHALPLVEQRGTWLSLEEAMTLTGWARSWVYEQDAAKKVSSRPSGSHGRNGKPRREYLLSSLPTEAQIRYANQQAEHALAARPAAESLPLFDSAPSAVPEDLSDQARMRLRVVEQILEYRKSPKAFRAGGRTIETLDAFANWVGGAQQPQLSARTIYRWVARFEKAIDEGTNPYAALADAPRKDQGKSKFFAQHPAAAAWVIAKYVGPKDRISNLRLLHEALAREWPKLSIKGEPPSYATLRAYVDSKITLPMRTYAHNGPEAYSAQYAPFIVRKRPNPMDWWVLDHRILDIRNLNSVFPTLKRDEDFRLHFTGVVDWGSQSWVGYCCSPQASWRTVASALRMAICDYGFPKNLYWDNGEDFKKIQRMLTGANATSLTTATDKDEFAQAMRVFLKGVGVEIGITRALPYNAGAKMIEGMFSGVRKRFDIVWGDAYQGSSPEQRSEYNEMAQKRHKRFLAGEQAESPFPRDVEVIAALGQWMHRENSRPRQSLDGKSRFVLLDAAVKKNAQPPVQRRMLDVLFCERDIRKVDRGGVKLDNRRYEPASDADMLAIEPYQKREIVVLRDPYCLEEATAVDPETLRFIGELRLQEFVAQCPNGHITRDQIQARLRKERALKRTYANYIAFYAALASAQGWKTERDILLEEAGVKTIIAEAAPGAAPKQLTERSKFVPDSPFVDDAAKNFIAAMNEGAD
jgi:hypothetical protein